MKVLSHVLSIMANDDEESITRTEQTKKKKKKKKRRRKSKQDNSGKIIVGGCQCHNSKNTIKKKHKKKANATEDASEIMHVVPKKKNDETMASCDPKTNDDVPIKKTTLDQVSLGDPTSTEGTHKKKNKKNVLVNEISTYDHQTNDDNPEKKKNKNVASCKLKSNDPVHKKKAKETNLKAKKKKTILKSKAVTEDNILTSVPENNIVLKKKKRTKKDPSSLRSKEDKDITIDLTMDELDCSCSDNLSNSKRKKRKKSKTAEGNFVNEASEAGSVVTKKKKKVSELVEESRSSKDDHPEMSDHADVKKKKKKKKATSVKIEDEAINDHDVHHGKEGGDSISVGKKKKMKSSIIDEESGSLQGNKEMVGHGASDLNGNKVKDNGITSKEALKKKKGNKAKEKTESVKGTVGSCEEKKKKSKKRKAVEMINHTDEEHRANEDTTEVPKKKKKIQEGERQDVYLVSAEDGNKDEIHIDTGTKFGQWDSATFQNSEQQTKFLRLLGGFKKGNQATLTSTSNQEQANMALGKEGEHILQRNLLAEFDKAVSWKQNRGIGLGFQPAQKKTFYIDQTASRSVKLDD
ncbi:lysine-rich nucleolar protein 1 isoform X2 [Rhinoderma darwinii]|uniref:lysine-rich nucleolar protein 1 isoform X2 n=1 Tax=Rhinoderma darwinii TaxID=43563 RepID=UPI003F674317